MKTARGIHIYCGTQEQIPTAMLLPGLEVRGEGGIIIAPPSLHPSGIRYAWLCPPHGELPPLPDWARQSGSPDSRDRAPGWVVDALRGVEEPRRNVTCARLVGYFLAKGVSPGVVEATLRAWNHLNRPPLPEREVLGTVASIVARGRRQRTEALPLAQGSLLEFMTSPLAQECTHGERSMYQAVCVVEWLRGLQPGMPLHVSYRELQTRGGVSPQRACSVLSRLAERGLIEFRPAGRVGGLRGQGAYIRRLPIPPALQR